jgi:23S rRNA A2030 N6-methylase RlmJ
MASDYDHNKKAGNEGDTAKHVALLAALVTGIRKSPSSPFRYADLYAGYYTSTLIGHEWQRGIGRLKRDQSSKNEFVAEWLKLFSEHPKAEDAYPGSTKIAVRSAELAGREIQISAYDTSAAAVESLRANIRPPHQVFDCAANPSDGAVAAADFLFIDPPSRRCYGAIARDYLADSEKTLMLWLPMNLSGDSKKSAAPNQDIERAKKLGLRYTIIEWPLSGGGTWTMFGCSLLYRLPEFAADAVCEALSELCLLLAGWSVRSG